MSRAVVKKKTAEYKELLELRNILAHESRPISEEAFDDRSFQSARYQLLLKEQVDVLKMRASWSTIFKIILCAIVAFEGILTILVGCNYLVYEDEWFLKIIITGGLANILLMPLIIIKFLFPNNVKSPN